MLDAHQILEKRQDELDTLFRSSAAGDIPRGKGRGTVIFAPDTIVGRIVAKLAYLIAWQGKVFDPGKDELLNLITPFGLSRIRAQVYKETSWFDAQECIVLDYSKTSVVAHRIRDEIREVDDGIYLGLVFWGKRQILKFVLEFPRS